MQPSMVPGGGRSNLSFRGGGAVLGSLLTAMGMSLAGAADLGVFSSHGDIGTVAKAGSVEFDPSKGRYVVGGGGENIWFRRDACQFVWTRMSGDVRFAATVRWVGSGGQAHRKACLMLREGLATDSAYADAVIHGNGLTSLQYREASGELTHEIQASVSGPDRVCIEKRGDYVSLFLASGGDELRPAGGAYRLRLKEPCYIGLAVCAHRKEGFEEAEFSQIEIKPLPPSGNAKPVIESTLETVAIASRDRRVVFHTGDRIEAPNWSRDGQSLIYNRGGRLWRLPVRGGRPQALDTGPAVHCNNDHGLSPDGKQLAVSDQSSGDNKSRIYVLPVGGGEPRRVTPLGPSYWHGWSPDGNTLAYCAERNGEFDVYTIPAEGGEEKRLTSAAGLDDGPDYSQDGRYIYFNSERSGSMQIWRMKADGSEQSQVTSDDYNNWFAHPSPDGKWLVVLSYPKGVKGHPENQDVTLRLMPTSGGPVQVLAKLFGGQGTMNVPSWSPDSKQVAFVSYQPVYP